MNDWYYAKGGTQSGPVDFEMLRGLARAGRISAEDLVWNETMKDWQPARMIPGLLSEAGDIAANPYAVSGQALVPPAMIPVFDEAALPEIAPGSQPVGVWKSFGRSFTLMGRHIGVLLLAGLINFGIAFAVQLPFMIMDFMDTMAGISSSAGSPGAAPFQPPSWQSYLSPGAIIQQVVSTVASVFLMGGLLRIGLNVISGREPTLGQLFGGWPVFGRLLGCYFTYWIVWLIGSLGAALPGYFLVTRHLLPFFNNPVSFDFSAWPEMVALVLAAFLLTVPGLYLANRVGFAMTAVVDRNLGFVESLRYSLRITQRNGWRLLLASVIMFVANFVGVILCGVGVIFTVPFALLFSCVLYRWMQYGPDAARDHPGTERPLLSSTP